MASNSFKGFIGELKLRLAMFFLLGGRYKVFSNVTILLPDNKTSQIDHVVVSRHGVFVIETKNYKGEITINERTGYWTQSFSRNSYDFYSPIKQNEGHISALKYILKTKQSPFFNIVCFVGEATFTNAQLPEGVATNIRQAIRIIRGHKKKVMKSAQAGELIENIKRRRMKNNRRTRKLHLKNVKAKQRR